MSGPPTGVDDLASALREHADCKGNLGVSPGATPGGVVLRCPGCGGTSTHLLGESNGSTEREAAAAAALEVAVPSRGFAGAEYGTSHSSRVGRRRRIVRIAMAVVAVVAVAAATIYLLDPGTGVEVSEPARSQDTAEPQAATVDGAFSVEVPQGWTRSEVDGATVISPEAGGASVAVYYERGGVEPEEVAEQASAVLADRHPGAEVEDPESAGASGGDLVIRSVYPGGEERAVISVADGLALLTITELPAGTDPATTEAAARVASSVNPAS